MMLVNKPAGVPAHATVDNVGENMLAGLRRAAAAPPTVWIGAALPESSPSSPVLPVLPFYIRARLYNSSGRRPLVSRHKESRRA